MQWEEVFGLHSQHSSLKIHGPLNLIQYSLSLSHCQKEPAYVQPIMFSMAYLCVPHNCLLCMQSTYNILVSEYKCLQKLLKLHLGHWRNPKWTDWLIPLFHISYFTGSFIYSSNLSLVLLHILMMYVSSCKSQSSHNGVRNRDFLFLNHIQQTPLEKFLLLSGIIPST